MRSLNNVGLGLSVVFTCLLLALIAEIYYLLWWKRRIIRREIEDYNNPGNREFMYMFCCKKPSISLSVNPTNAHQTHQSEHYPDFQFHAQQNKDYFLTPFNENGIETQLVTGPPRFLFTIKEETREDLESEDGKTGKKRSSLNDLLKNMDTPYLTPISSPAFLTPMGSSHSCGGAGGGDSGGGGGSGGCGSGGYNPFNESSSDAEFSRMIKASPPPKFKFLRDAEEKLQRRTMLMEEAKRKQANLHRDSHEQNQDGSFINIIVAKSNECDQPNHNYHYPQCQTTSSSSSSSSQVLPLPPSPATLAPSNRILKSSMTK